MVLELYIRRCANEEVDMRRCASKDLRRCASKDSRRCASKDIESRVDLVELLGYERLYLVKYIDG